MKNEINKTKHVSSKPWKIATSILGATTLAASATAIVLGVRKVSTDATATDYSLTTQIDSGIQSISFTVNGKAATKAKAGDAVKVIIKEKEDYVLTSLTYNGVEIREAKEFIMPNKDCAVQAKTTSNVAIITLELNGGTTTGSTQIKIPKGEYFAYADLPEVTKSNASKGEWYFDGEMTEMVTPDTIISESTTLHLNWFEKFADKPNCVGIHANKKSQLLAFYDAIIENNSNNQNGSTSEPGVISLEDLKYSYDGVTWYSISGTSLELQQGKNIYFYSQANDPSTAGGENAATRLVIHGDVSLGGSIMGLIYNGNPTEEQNKHLPEKAGFCLFKDSDGISAVAKDFIPATIIDTRGCERMFSNCVNLQIAPELPAAKVGSYGYYQMFKGCTKLYAGPTSIGVTSAEEQAANPWMGYASCNEMFSECSNLIKAPDLLDYYPDEYAYQKMFQNCTSLTTEGLPKIHAIKMRTYTCGQMFSNCTSLNELPDDFFSTITHVSASCFEKMFESCTSLTKVGKLPATKCWFLDDEDNIWKENEGLDFNCYDCMFSNCKSLTTVPTDMLPSETLYDECYAGMFQYCDSLRVGPNLPAKTLSTSCYENMFYQSGITIAPELPATTLAEKCYCSMFAFCRNLINAPKLLAQNLTADCYRAMFFECSALETAQVGSDDPTKPIITSWTGSPGCCGQMFQRCRSLKTVKLNYGKYLSNSYFSFTFIEVGGDMVLYTDSTTTSFDSDCIDWQVLIKPFSDAKTFVQVLPADFTAEGEEPDQSSIVPFTMPGGNSNNIVYSTKYGVCGKPNDHSSRFTYDSSTTLANVLQYFKNQELCQPKPGCYIKNYQYLDTDGVWKDLTESSTQTLKSFNSDVTFRTVFAPTKIVTCSWDELITQINKLYEPEDWTAYDAAVEAFCQYFTETDKFEPQNLLSFVGVTRELTLNNQKHNVVIASAVDSGTDYTKPLVNAPSTQILQYAAFVFQFTNVISDKNGYSLATTWNGSGDATEGKTSYDYTSSDLRKAIDGQGSGTIRWFRKGETAKTEDPDYKDKSVLDMINTANPNLYNNMKTVTESTYCKVDDEVAQVDYQTKLFIPNDEDLLNNMYLYGNKIETVTTRVLRQVKATDGSLTKPTLAEDDDQNKVINNYAGFNYNNDLWYGSNYWLSHPHIDDWSSSLPEISEKQACVVLYAGWMYFDVDEYGEGDYWYNMYNCDISHYALSVSPFFCI